MYTQLHISAYFLTLTEWSIFTQRLQAHNSPVIDTAGIVQLPMNVDAKGEDNSNLPNQVAPNYIITQYSCRNKQFVKMNEISSSIRYNLPVGHLTL